MLVTLRGRRRLDRVLRTALAALSLAFLPLTTEGQETGRPRVRRNSRNPLRRDSGFLAADTAFIFGCRAS